MSKGLLDEIREHSFAASELLCNLVEKYIRLNANKQERYYFLDTASFCQETGMERKILRKVLKQLSINKKIDFWYAGRGYSIFLNDSETYNHNSF